MEDPRRSNRKTIGALESSLESIPATSEKSENRNRFALIRFSAVEIDGSSSLREGGNSPLKSCAEKCVNSFDLGAADRENRSRRLSSPECGFAE